MNTDQPSRRLTLQRYLPILLISLALIALTPINTDVNLRHMIVMATMLGAAVTIPAIFSMYVFRDGIIHFPFRHGRSWYRREILYIGITALIAYLVLPFYLTNTGSYHNWSVHREIGYIIRLFIGTELLGAWDEFFFVNTVLSVLRRVMSFWYANVIQAVLWITFLYVLGFRGWGPIPLFFFCLSQGYIFKRTKSLLYVLSIHLTLDLILYLAVLHTHFSSWVPIFIT